MRVNLGSNLVVPFLCKSYTKGKNYLFQLIPSQLKDHSFSLKNRSVQYVLNGALLIGYIGVAILVFRAFVSNFYFLYHLKTWADKEPIGEAQKKRAVQAIKDCYVNRSSRLSLKELGVTSLPKCLFHFTWIKQLDLSGNQLKEVPLGIQNMIGLERLILSRNILVELPEFVGCLTKLKELDLSYNYLVKVSSSAVRTLFEKRLEVLNLERNLLPAYAEREILMSSGSKWHCIQLSLNRNLLPGMTLLLTLRSGIKGRHYKI